MPAGVVGRHRLPRPPVPVARLRRGRCGEAGNGNRHQKLSPREREVMTMILTGRRLKEIAAVLDISVKTVTTHRSRLLRKLGVEDNLGLYRYGVRHGLISV